MQGCPLEIFAILKALICSFLKLLRDMVNFQTLHIGKNNFKPLQQIKIHRILLVWEIFVGSVIF